MQLATLFRREAAPRHRAVLPQTLSFLLLWWVTAVAQDQVAPDHAVKMKAGLRLFRSQVRGILEDNCLKCHNARASKADFDLSSRASLLGSGFVQSTADESHLLALIRHTEEPHMPLKAPQLSAPQTAAIAKWIDLGAPYDRPLGDTAGPTETSKVTAEDRQFWSFAPLRKPIVPKAKSAWPRNALDQFIWSKLSAARLRPSDPADRPTLIRRVYFDLVGLPPHPDEVTQFVDNPDPHALERVVDRLLNSRHYGERWARHWLDVARFGESSGYEHDDDRQHAYHYRDFVIQAFNTDLPYDRFVRWQIAGDEMEPDAPLASMATGFLSAGPFATQVTETEFESTRYDELDDMVANAGLAFLGLSFGCARCHDHKFDPIPTEDYYAMLAVFGRTVRSEQSLVLEPAAEPTPVQVTGDGFPPMKTFSDGRGYKHFYEHVYQLQRGDVHQKHGVASPGYAQVLMRNGKTAADWVRHVPDDWSRSDLRRSAFAHWITDPDDGAGHLAARVIVNRLWQHHFGEGLVRTPNDFGLRGDAPSHPELLDWLASTLIENDWSLKHLHRWMVTSATYRQKSDFRAAAARHDGENRLHWRRTPRRLEAEAIRDSMLSVSGRLDRQMFGRGSLDESMRRRSIYFTIKRSKLIPSMMLFDWPEHLVSIGKRPVTTTAPQALLMMNNAQTRDYASGFAKRLRPHISGDAEKPAERNFRPAVTFAYQAAYGRAATDEEIERSETFIRHQIQAYPGREYADAEQAALQDFAQVVFASNEFLFVR